MTNYRDAETVSESVPARHEAPDVAELRRLLDALPGFTLRHLHGGPGGESYIALADEGGMPLSDSGFDAVLFFAEIAALEVPRLLDHLAHMRDARDAARAEAERMAAKLDAIEADDDKLSIMFGWLVYDVGEHTCGGYGPESGYAHEPGCGFEPVLRLDKLEGWPGEKPLDGGAES